MVQGGFTALFIHSGQLCSLVLTLKPCYLSLTDYKPFGGQQCNCESGLQHKTSVSIMMSMEYQR